MIAKLNRYVLVGMFNTAVCSGLMMALVAMNMNVYLANAINYLFGLILSYYLQKTLVFAYPGHRFKTFALVFFSGVALSYCTLHAAYAVLHINKYLASLASIATFVGFTFIVNNFHTFRKSAIDCQPIITTPEKEKSRP